MNAKSEDSGLVQSSKLVRLIIMPRVVRSLMIAARARDYVGGVEDTLTLGKIREAENGGSTLVASYNDVHIRVWGLHTGHRFPVGGDWCRLKIQTAVSVLGPKLLPEFDQPASEILVQASVR